MAQFAWKPSGFSKLPTRIDRLNEHSSYFPHATFNLPLLTP
jgi:hypothetical protein